MSKQFRNIIDYDVRMHECKLSKLKGYLVVIVENSEITDCKDLE